MYESDIYTIFPREGKKKVQDFKERLSKIRGASNFEKIDLVIDSQRFEDRFSKCLKFEKDRSLYFLIFLPLFDFIHRFL